MNTQNRKPRWRQLMLLVPLMIGLLLMDTHLALSPLAHQLIEVGVVLLMYGAMACWLWANQEALESETEQEEPWSQVAPQAGQARDDLSLQAWVEQDLAEQSQLTESTLPASELQQVLSRQDIRCAPPSGARLN